MISLAEINAVSERYKVSPEIIEKDYVICWILACFAGSALNADFAFYGGTAIKRAYFEDHRFSEDIDLLSAQDYRPDRLIERLSECLRAAKEETNLILTVDPARTISAGTRTQAFVHYAAFDEITGAPKDIRIDFATDMHCYGETQEAGIIGSYSDLRGRRIPVRTHTLNTILASKLGLLTDRARNEPRDIFDVWFILKRVDAFDFDPGKVQKFFKEKYGFALSPDVLRAHLENRTYRERWKTRLEKQIADLPSIESITGQIQEKLAVLFPSA